MLGAEVSYASIGKAIAGYVALLFVTIIVPMLSTFIDKQKEKAQNLAGQFTADAAAVAHTDAAGSRV